MFVSQTVLDSLSCFIIKYLALEGPFVCFVVGAIMGNNVWFCFSSMCLISSFNKNTAPLSDTFPHGFIILVIVNTCKTLVNTRPTTVSLTVAIKWNTEKLLCAIDISIKENYYLCSVWINVSYVWKQILLSWRKPKWDLADEQPLYENEYFIGLLCSGKLKSIHPWKTWMLS